MFGEFTYLWRDKSKSKKGLSQGVGKNKMVNVKSKWNTSHPASPFGILGTAWLLWLSGISSHGRNTTLSESAKRALWYKLLQVKSTQKNTWLNPVCCYSRYTLYVPLSPVDCKPGKTPVLKIKPIHYGVNSIEHVSVLIVRAYVN